MATLDANSLVNQFKRRKLFGISIMISVVSVLLLLVVVYPQVRHILETRKANAAKREEIAKLKTKAQQLSQDLVQTDYFANNDLVQLALPNQKPLLEVLTSLDQVKRAAQVELYDLQTNPGSLASDSGKIAAGKKELAASIPLAFSVKGTFDQISNFMDLFEKVAPFTTITSFEISGSNTNSAAPEDPEAPKLIQVTIESKTFFYNPNVKQNITAPLPNLSQENGIVLAKLAEFMTIPLPEQREITGGGSEDIFGVKSIEGL